MMSSNPLDDELFAALREMRRLYPHWRFGQLVTNITVWAGDEKIPAIWDVEDSQLLAVVRRHLESRDNPK